MKKNKSNVSMYDICNFPQQRYLIMNTFKYISIQQQKTTSIVYSKPKITKNKW